MYIHTIHMYMHCKSQGVAPLQEEPISDTQKNPILYTSFRKRALLARKVNTSYKFYIRYTKEPYILDLFPEKSTVRKEKNLFIQEEYLSCSKTKSRKKSQKVQKLVKSTATELFSGKRSTI